jgi:4'-phosphopantetheinyl transferase
MGTCLSRGDVVLHHITLGVQDDERDRLEAALSDDERRRAQRFRFVADRDRFVVVRARLRVLLAGYGAGSAARIRFGYGAEGKPLVPSHPELGFNVSHSGERALIAVALGREVGVDVERLDPDRTGDAIARRFFSRAENAALARLQGRARVMAFYRCWCRKEAYVKARGDGLSLALDSFDVAVDAGADQGASLLLATRPDAGEAARWDLRAVDVGSGYVAALAARGRIGGVSCCATGTFRPSSS